MTEGHKQTTVMNFVWYNKLIFLNKSCDTKTKYITDVMGTVS